MATSISVQSISEQGLNVSFSAVDDSAGNKASNLGGNLIFIVRNEDASDSAIATVTAQKTSKNDPAYGLLAKANPTKTIAAGEQAVFGPFPKVPFNDGNGDVDIQFSGTAPSSLEIAAIELP